MDFHVDVLQARTTAINCTVRRSWFISLYSGLHHLRRPQTLIQLLDMSVFPVHQNWKLRASPTPLEYMGASIKVVMVLPLYRLGDQPATG